MSRATRCSACRSDGVVRVRGTTLCGSCALGLDSLPRATLVPRRSHVRAQVVSVFAAVIATLAALGTVAIVSTAGSPATIHPSKADAHGGPATTPDVIWALPGPLSDDTPSLAVSGAPATTGTPRGTSSAAGGTTETPAVQEVVELAGAFVAATKAWADCVADAAPTQDMAACGDQPVPADHGLETALAAVGWVPPGQALQDDPSPVPPGQAKKDDPDAAPPGQAKKDDLDPES